jgi:hypothetical protein
MQLFREIKREGAVDSGRGIAKSVSLPSIDYPRTIFFRKKNKKTSGKTKIVTNTQLSKFLRSRTQRGKKRKYFKKGKTHTVQKEYLQRNGYDKEGYLVS